MRSALSKTEITGLIEHCKIFNMIPLYSYWNGITQVVEKLDFSDPDHNVIEVLDKYPKQWIQYRSKVRKVLKEKYRWKYTAEAVKILNSVYLWRENGHKELV